MKDMMRRFAGKKGRWALGLVALVGAVCAALAMQVTTMADSNRYAGNVFGVSALVLGAVAAVSAVLWLASAICGLCSKYGIVRVRRVSLAICLALLCMGWFLDSMLGVPVLEPRQGPFAKDVQLYSKRMVPDWALAVPDGFLAGASVFLIVYAVLAAVSFYMWMAADEVEGDGGQV